MFYYKSVEVISKQKICYAKQFEDQIFYMRMIFFLKIREIAFFSKRVTGDLLNLGSLG